MWRITAALLLAAGTWASADTVRRLSPGSTVTGAVEPQQEHRFRVDLPEDEYAVIAVRGDDALPEAALTGSGTSLTHGRERVFFLRGGAGPRVLSVRAEAAAMKYRIDVLGAHAPPSQQDRRLAAERRFVAARHAASDGTAEAIGRALSGYAAAREAWRGLQDLPREAATLEEMALAHAQLAAHDEARRALDQALKLWKGIGDARGEARNLQLHATVEARAGDNRKARLLALDASARAYRLKDVALEAQSLNTLAAARTELGETAEARADYATALARSRAAGDRTEEARALAGLGHVDVLRGHNREALLALSQALAAWRGLDDPASEAAVLGSLGSAHLALGREDEAERHFLQALDRAARQPDRRLEVHALLNAGAIHQLRGMRGAALTAYRKALEESTALQHRVLQARAQHRIGRIYALEGRRTEAAESYGRALALADGAESLRDVSAVLADAGTLVLADDAARAREAFERGRELARSIADGVQEAAHLAGLAKVARRAGDLDTACRHAADALEAAEGARARTDGLERRASTLAAREDYYELNVALLMEREQAQPGTGHAARALQVAERARARGLLEMLGGSREPLGAGLPTELGERERRLREALSRAAAEHWHAEAPSAAEARRRAEEIRGWLREHETLRAEIRAASPHYAALVEPVPLDAAAIRKDVLDDETALLAYALGTERSHAWLLTREALSHVALPPRDEIEAVARRAYAALAHPRRTARGELEDATQALSRVLLAPLAVPPAIQRLLVVPDGALHYVPFGALPDPRGEGGAPLLTRYEIVSAPSASVVAVLRAETASRRPPEGRLAIFADPVFAATDARVRRAGSEAGEGPAGAEGDGLDRLPHSRAEAESALALLPAAHTRAAFDFAASRAAALDRAVGGHRIVHFATHGIVNARHPELSGLVLSLVDEAGRPQDGFLSLHDIYNLELAAELVVLSGCGTGVGTQARGEGLMGLTRGFMYAGAPRVVASLWSVSDRGTAELMAAFYKKMLAEGRPPAAALREAQLSVRRQPRWSHPSYWSGFVLYGEWR